MSTLSRQDARQQLADAIVLRMSAEERAAVLNEWWSLDSEDADWETLPHSLQNEMQIQNEPLADPTASKYDPLLRLAKMRETLGVRNSWIRQRLAEYGAGIGDTLVIVGAPERLLECRCCDYLTLHGRGEYEICPVCFWEDDGLEELDRLSGPNHMTLREARSNFARVGACSVGALRHIQPGVQEKYFRSENGGDE